MHSILVVEDEAAIAAFIQTLLEDEGYEVAGAANGAEALELLGDVRPDLVLSDLMMPVMDGMTMCRAIKADPDFRTIPIIFMSAVMTQPRLSDCSYEAFLRKPIDIDKLLLTIETAIAKQTPVEDPGILRLKPLKPAPVPLTLPCRAPQAVAARGVQIDYRPAPARSQ